MTLVAFALLKAFGVACGFNLRLRAFLGLAEKDYEPSRACHVPAEKQKGEHGGTRGKDMNSIALTTSNGR